ncbi:MAG: phosphoesterase [Pseudomonadota bacterium]
MRLQILYHGNCFDGVVSAAIFARFFREKIEPKAEIIYRPMAHGRGDPYGPDHDAIFNADQNAVVDFRYSTSPRLTWWCDHHQSAFLQPEDKKHFDADQTSQKCFDPTAPSCSGLLLKWLVSSHGFDGSPLADQAYWADLIDSARFESPRQAVELAEPALQLMALLESAPVPLANAMAEGLSKENVGKVHSWLEVQKALGPVLAAHRRNIDIVRSRMDVENGVAYFDLTADEVRSLNKFIPYYLNKEVKYTVGVTRTRDRNKISVGSNPWQRPEPLINLAELCQLYGGGGHPVVAGASFPIEELAEAQQAAREIANKLRG